MNSVNNCDSQSYQIRVQGHLSGQWAEWFDGLTITLEENGDTLFKGTMVDQAALFGFLRRIQNLGLPLVEVKRIEKK